MSKKIVSELSSALSMGHQSGVILRSEYKQYRDFYIGLISLNVQTNNLIARRLWRDLSLPLGGGT